MDSRHLQSHRQICRPRFLYAIPALTVGIALDGDGDRLIMVGPSKARSWMAMSCFMVMWQTSPEKQIKARYKAWCCWYLNELILGLSTHLAAKESKIYRLFALMLATDMCSAELQANDWQLRWRVIWPHVVY